jgi:hypothetical protein
VANVLEDRLDLSDVKSMNFTPKEFETLCVARRDILLNGGQLLTCADAARLKQSILKTASEGRLVSQDPTDELASALVARLKSDVGGSDKPNRRGGAANS